jgi:Tfp pilus assembly protein PilO
VNPTDLLNRMTMGRAVIIGFIVAGIYYFIFFDKGYVQQQSIDGLKTQRVELENQLRQAEAKVARAIVYKRSRDELGGTLGKLLSTIPENFGLDDLMKIVSNEAKVAGSNLVNITRRPEVAPPPKSEFQELEVEVELIGSYNQHMIFLSNLTKVNQILTIRKLNMDVVGTPSPNEQPATKMNATIVAYRYIRNATESQ